MVLVKALEDALNWPLPASLVAEGRDITEVALRQFTLPVTWKRTPTGWIARDLHKGSMTGQVGLSADDDGLIHLFAGRIGDRADGTSTGRLFVYDEFLVAYGARFARFLGLLYERCRYLGPVNAGIRLIGLLRAVKYRPRQLFFDGEWRYQEPEYRRTTRLPASQLMNDPKALGRDLISPFLQTLTQGQFDPYAGTQP